MTTTIRSTLRGLSSASNADQAAAIHSVIWHMEAEIDMEVVAKIIKNDLDKLQEIMVQQYSTLGDFRHIVRGFQYSPSVF